MKQLKVEGWKINAEEFDIDKVRLALEIFDDSTISFLKILNE